ncbi:MAG: cobalamin/Fe(3+)-siderophore ABC transporter ATP-binding protein [Gammaproteobacteria bacterium]|nr:cobalamin/Fe(3+)-siderophore ABC transporter ATP-binding protein [Gammaproteobacteria bacterium]
MDDELKIKLKVEKLVAGYDQRRVLRGIDLAIPEGKLTMVLGINGCGKSTLLKCLSRLLNIDAGSILFEGKSLHDFSAKTLARHLASLPQNPIAPAGITVFDLVAKGRTPYQSFLRQWSEDDEEIVKSSICKVQLDNLAGAFLSELSGGQRQRAWIAMSLAQSTKTLLLDEPTANLDPYHQIDIFRKLKGLCLNEDKTVVVVVQDLNMALQFADHVVVLRDGKVVASSSTDIALTQQNILEAFDIKCEIVETADKQHRALIPISS